MHASDISAVIIGGGLAACAFGLGYVVWYFWRQRKLVDSSGGAAQVNADGEVEDETPKPPPIPSQDKIGATQDLIDVMALVGNALLLKNGSFVRMIEVAPVDLESVDQSIKLNFWSRFTDAMRAVRAPISLQIVITTRPQDISQYLDKWKKAATDWNQLAEKSATPTAAARRARMTTSALDTTAFLMAAHEHLQPMQQRYLVVITYNPFPEAQTNKKREHLLNPKLAREALDKLDENSGLVKGALSRLGLPMYDLDPAAMCQVLWEHYHHPQSITGNGLEAGYMLEALNPNHVSSFGANGQGTDHFTQCPPRDEFQRAATDSRRLADLIAPAMIDEQPNSLRVGDVIGRGYIIFDFDTRGAVDLSALLAFNADMTHSLYIAPADPAIIRQQLREKETEMKSGQITDARRGIVTDWGQQAAIQSAERLRAEVEMTLQAPFFLHWFCMVWANDALVLEKKCQQFETRLKGMGLRFHHATRVQLNVFQSMRPLHRRVYATEGRNMSAESLGPLFPFARCEYFDPNGWHFGYHRGNGMLVCVDAFREGQENASEVIIGKSGGGKSVYMKQTIESLLALGHRVFVIDPEREYLRMAIDYHAPYLEMGKIGAPPRLYLQANERNGGDAWLGGLMELGGLYESLSGRKPSQTQVDQLTFCYRELMEDAGILRELPETWAKEPPLVQALIDRLNADPAASAYELARVLAYYVQLQVGGNRINIMDINLDSESPWEEGVESLAAFVDVILGEQMNPHEVNALARNYQATLERFGIRQADRSTWDLPKGMPKPTLSSLAQVLAFDSAPESRKLAGVLERYAQPGGTYSDFFNCQTTVDLHRAQFAVFGMQSVRSKVDDRVGRVFAWQILQLMWNTVVAGGAAQPIHLFVDEAWFVLEYPGAAKRLTQMARSFRKHYAAIHVATQDMDSLLASPEAKSIVNIGGIRILFAQDTDDAAQALGRIVGLSAAEKSSLGRASKGEGLLLIGNRMRIPIHTAVNPLRLPLLSTNVSQQRAVARASGRRPEPVL